MRPRGRWSRRFTVLCVVALTAVALALLMHLPRELVALAKNRERVRQLQEENNDLSKRLNGGERLRNPKENFSEQDWRSTAISASISPATPYSTCPRRRTPRLPAKD